MILPIMIPIGALLSWLGSCLRSSRDKLRRDSRDPALKDVPIFGFEDLSKLPLPENDAIALAELRIAERDFEAAKHLLINAWLLTAPGPQNELAFLQLKQGFVRLYIAKGERERADRISAMPPLLLDREVQWIVTHPDQPLIAACLESPAAEAERHDES